MASEKAAAEFQLEKEVKRLHEAQVRRQSSLRFIYVLLLFIIFTRKVLNLLIQVEVERSRVSRRPSATWEEDSEIKTLEYVF